MKNTRNIDTAMQIIASLHILAAIFLITMAQALQAHACSLGSQSIEEELAMSDAVFKGIARTCKDHAGEGAIVYRPEIVWKGPKNETFLWRVSDCNHPNVQSLLNRDYIIFGRHISPSNKALESITKGTFCKNHIGPAPSKLSAMFQDLKHNLLGAGVPSIYTQINSALQKVKK